MLRNLISRLSALAAGVAVLAGATLSTSCGGGGYAAREMVLVEFLFVDRALNPTAPTGAQSLPRNAQLLMKFSEQVNASTVTNQTIQIRYSSTLIPTGSFSVNGSQVRFDPTVTNQGQPNPKGFDSVTQYTVFIPSFLDDQGDAQLSGVIENRDGDPNTTTFRTAFETGAGFLRELEPPTVLSVFFIPDPEPLTGNIRGNGQMVFQFSEAMDEASFILGPPFLPVSLLTTVDVRYDSAEQINIDNLVAGSAIPGYFTFDPSLTQAIFNPTFSFGAQQLVFYAQVFQGVKDLSGNLLKNPRTFGNFKVDGFGSATGKVLDEAFVNTTDRDGLATDADWGSTTTGVLIGQPVSSRQALIFGYLEAGNSPNSGRGQYAPLVDPLTGAALNQFVANISPPTNLGRRVMLAFEDTEIGANGSITAAGWGPDSNATFAALYQNIYLRMGYQATDSLSLSTSFSSNYASGQGTVLYNGNYAVTQKASVGNTVGQPAFAHVGGYAENPGCQVGGTWNLPLFSATGFTAWPALTTFFEWDQGSNSVNNDSILLFDMSVPEGDTWQQFRAWFGVTFPCSGVLIGGYPQRRLYSTYEEDAANPTANVNAGVLNPEPTVYDTSFTVTKRVSLAQSLFYTFPGFASQAGGGNTFGDLTNYLPVQLTPTIQGGGAIVTILFQGADIVELDRRTINLAGDWQDWTNDINDCDGLKCLRWRISLISNLISNARAKLNRVLVPMTSL